MLALDSDRLDLVKVDLCETPPALALLDHDEQRRAAGFLRATEATSRVAAEVKWAAAPAALALTWRLFDQPQALVLLYVAPDRQAGRVLLGLARWPRTKQHP